MTKVRRSMPDRAAQRPAAYLLLLTIVAGLMAPVRATAQPPQTQGVDRWQVYDTTFSHSRDDAVPGAGTVSVQSPKGAGEPWSSGAAMHLLGAIAFGERVTAIFGARAAQPTRRTVALQGGEPGYARFTSAEAALMHTWQQVVVSGTAPAAFAAESQSLSIPLGLIGAEVTLGPVEFLRGNVDAAAIRGGFADFWAPAVAVDVRIPSEPGVVLAGTLHLPSGDGGPFPLAVLIQGSGPNGRGGFTEIVKRLTADGIVALEYDKRGIGQSTGRYQEDLERLTADAAAAVTAMRRRPEIDGRRIALVGQSQGGVIAPAVAAADPAIAAVVMLAGSVGDGLSYLRRAIRSQMVYAGRREAVVIPAVDAAMALLQARIDGRGAEAIALLRQALVDRFEAAGFTLPEAEGALAIIDTEQAYGAGKLRSASDLKALRIPVLAVFGAMDPLVVASDEAPAARAALAGNPRGEVVLLEGLSHWFQEGAITGRAEEVATLGQTLDRRGWWRSSASGSATRCCCKAAGLAPGRNKLPQPLATSPRRTVPSRRPSNPAARSLSLPLESFPEQK